MIQIQIVVVKEELFPHLLSELDFLSHRYINVLHLR